jgi:hypothetical protein
MGLERPRQRSYDDPGAPNGRLKIHSHSAGYNPLAVNPRGAAMSLRPFTDLLGHLHPSMIVTAPGVGGQAGPVP